MSKIIHFLTVYITYIKQETYKTNLNKRFFKNIQNYDNSIITCFLAEEKTMLTFNALQLKNTRVVSDGDRGNIPWDQDVIRLTQINSLTLS